ncbi:hypothetical protein OC834_006462 [Tilletia horrida]|nr:hypothetical protein OC834_006462 [Tilletia horrida]KAK0559598.1 hypothetical protein OC844_004309 [Tilletia horrida]
MDVAARQAVFATLADFEHRLYEAGGAIAQYFEQHQAQQPFLNLQELLNQEPWFVAVNGIMNPVMAGIHDICRATPGFREGELLIFKDQNVTEMQFEQYFVELCASLQAGPLGRLVDEEGGNVVTGVKCSGMGAVNPEADEPCIAVMFENCWNLQIARLIYDCIVTDHQHEHLRPFGMKPRVHTALGLYYGNVYNVRVCTLYDRDLR